jgi:hypothetical protein
MKTFLMIYDSKSQLLIDEYGDNVDPVLTLGSWFFEDFNKISYDELKELTIFYYTGSNVQIDRKAGVIKYNSITDKIEFQQLPMYYLVSFDGYNVIYEKAKDIVWHDVENSYLILPDIDEFDEQEKLEYSIEVEILIPHQEFFLRSKKKFQKYFSLKGRKYPKLILHELKLISFHKKCRKCGNELELTIANMIDGRFSCPVCIRDKKLLEKK